MDLNTAIRGRRSSRSFLPEALHQEIIEQLIEAATWAPSPANNQPWEFIVITSPELKEKIFAEAENRKQLLFEKSGWKWLNRYDVHFLKDVPLILAVVGDPTKTGADKFLKDGGMAYQHACAAAIQNILLTAHSLGLGSLWFTLFEKDALREILDIDSGKDPVALVCVGKPAGEPLQTPRKAVQEKTSYRK